MVSLISHALYGHGVIFLILLEGYFNMVGREYAQRLQDESKSIEVTGDKD